MFVVQIPRRNIKTLKKQLKTMGFGTPEFLFSRLLKGNLKIIHLQLFRTSCGLGKAFGSKEASGSLTPPIRKGSKIRESVKTHHVP